MRLAALVLLCLTLVLSVASCDLADSNQNDADGNSSETVDSASRGQDEATGATSDEAGADGSSDSATDGNDADERAAADGGVDAEPSAGDAEERLAATVNGTPILLGDFQRQAFDTQRFYVEQGLDPNSEDGQRQLLYLRRQVLDDMINQTLVESAADELGITVTDEEIDERLQTYTDKYGTGEDLEAALAEVGTTPDEIREMERSSLIGQKMLDVITEDVPTTARFVRARHILCNTEEDCEAALARLGAGEAFEDVAKDVSEDTASAELGGDLDWITTGMLPSQQLEDEIFSLPVGGRSPVVLTDFGYHVIEVVDEDGSRELSEEQRYSLREKRLMEWLIDRRASSDIVIYIEDLKNLE